MEMHSVDAVVQGLEDEYEPTVYHGLYEVAVHRILYPHGRL